MNDSKASPAQFEERDLRAANQQRDSKLAVNAALQAAKEAVSEQNKANSLSISKSEAAFSKQIDQIGILINTSVDSLKSNLDDVKSRLTLLEGTGKGSKDLMAVIFTVVGIGVAIVAAIIAFQKIT